MGLEAARADSVEGDQVAIAITHGLLGSHLGIVYRDGDDKQKLLHLAFHRLLLDEDFPCADPWAVLKLALPEWRLVQVIALIRKLSKKYVLGRNSVVTYGINLYAGIDAIKEDMTYELGQDGDGLTCASFVAAAFKAIGSPLVNLPTWEYDQINEIWGRAVVCMLRVYNADLKHIEKVEANINGLRLRPEEVVAGAELLDPKNPAEFKDVQLRAPEIIKEMIAICGAPTEESAGQFDPCVQQYKKEMLAAKNAQELAHKSQTDAESKEATDGNSDLAGSIQALASDEASANAQNFLGHADDVDNGLN